MKLKLTGIILIIGILASCQKKEDDLISGVRLTGDKNTDLLLLLATRETCTRITSSNTAIVYSGSSLVVCSNVENTATFTVPSDGSYRITTKAGSQRLSASGCNSRSFDFNVIFKDGNTNLASSSESAISTVTVNLSANKTYTISNDGLVDPSNFRCSGRIPSSFVSDFSITFAKQ